MKCTVWSLTLWAWALLSGSPSRAVLLCGSGEEAVEVRGSGQTCVRRPACSIELPSGNCPSGTTCTISPARFGICVSHDVAEDSGLNNDIWYRRSLQESEFDPCFPPERTVMSILRSSTALAGTLFMLNTYAPDILAETSEQIDPRNRTLSNTKTYLAPTNFAWQLLVEDNNLVSLDDLTQAQGEAAVRHLIMNGDTLFENLEEGDFGLLTSLDDEKLVARRARGEVIVEGARVLAEDLIGSTGVVQVVDRVPLPVLEPLSEIIPSDPDAGEYWGLVESVGLDSLFRNASALYTAFVPDDASIRAAQLDDADEDSVRSFILSTILDGKIYSDMFIDGDVFQTLNGTQMPIEVDGLDVLPGGAFLFFPNVQGSNGVAHIVSGIPQTKAVESANSSSSESDETPTLASELSERVAKPMATSMSSKSGASPLVVIIISSVVGLVGITFGLIWVGQNGKAKRRLDAEDDEKDEANSVDGVELPPRE